MNNRQNGRRRGRGGQQMRNGQPGAPDRGNRIDNRARGNAAQLLEKYKNLARDAQTQGDRVNTEYYLQFADHYFRVLSESRSRFDEQRPRTDYRDDFMADDEGGTAPPRETRQHAPVIRDEWTDEEEQDVRETEAPRRAEPAAPNASRAERGLEGEPAFPGDRFERPERSERPAGERRPRRNGRAPDRGEAEGTSPAADRIAVEGLPQPIAPVDKAPTEEIAGEEAPRPRRRTPRRPRVETIAAA